MDKNKWYEYLSKYSLEPCNADVSYKNHLSNAIEFLKDCKVDKKELKLLDVGCGSGIVMKYIKSEWFGIDMNAGEYTKNNTNFTKEDIHVLPYEDKTFDIVFCCHTLEHVLSPFICLSEMKRILKDDGSIILSIPILPHFVIESHFYILTHKSWRHMLDILKLKIINIENLSHTINIHCKKLLKPEPEPVLTQHSTEASNHLEATRREFLDFTKRKSIDVKGMKVLDVGCRSGLNIPFFKWQLKMKWAGIDTNPEDRYTQKMDMTNLSALDDNYDFVFACHTLEHCINPYQALGELKEILKDGGWLFLSLPCLCDFHTDEIDHIFCFNEMQIKKLFTYFRFKDIECYKGKHGGYGDDKDLYNIICVGRKDIETNKIIYENEKVMYETETDKLTGDTLEKDFNLIIGDTN